jgi:hypothetical protein
LDKTHEVSPLGGIRSRTNHSLRCEAGFRAAHLFRVLVRLSLVVGVVCAIRYAPHSMHCCVLCTVTATASRANAVAVRQSVSAAALQRLGFAARFSLPLSSVSFASRPPSPALFLNTPNVLFPFAPSRFVCAFSLQERSVLRAAARQAAVAPFVPGGGALTQSWCQSVSTRPWLRVLLSSRSNGRSWGHEVATLASLRFCMHLARRFCPHPRSVSPRHSCNRSLAPRSRCF